MPQPPRIKPETTPTLDLTGYKCPMPVVRTEAVLRRTAPGDSFLVLADDPLAVVDIPHFCKQSNSLAIRQPDKGSADRPVCVFLVTRGPNPA